ncbi:CehA/McbA family metallohydrolase [Hydrocarboniphaga sp.]|uniref:CehA/McbA family metallohydrolase n=1 Tax=Hydrocarboniphaga sp. TaxID=2033016 RepID=UPI003D0F0F0A
MSLNRCSYLLVICLCLAACDTSAPSAHNEASASPGSPGTPTLPPVASLKGGLWMKGDLHIHSRHSTDSSNNPESKIIALGERVGMDYLAISDHDNHVNGDVAHNTWTDPEFRSNSLLLLYSAELTTARGHANPFSAKPYNHQRLYDARDGLDTTLAKIIKEEGVHFSANHPNGADHFGFSYDMVDSMEVWNSSIWSSNAGSLLIWQDMLNSGRNITARGGSDSHHGYPGVGDTPGQNSIQAGANNVGTPTTWVYATARTSEAVIAALTNGRVSISSNPNAPRVELYADLDQDGTMDMMMGDNTAPTGSAVAFRVDLVGVGAAVAPYTVTVIKNGATFGTYTVLPTSPSLSFTDTPATGERSYYRVQVEGQQALYPEVPASALLSANMIALSNPVYFNFNRPR